MVLYHWDIDILSTYSPGYEYDGCESFWVKVRYHEYGDHKLLGLQNVIIPFQQRLDQLYVHARW
jgi:hypothetical protein